MPVYLLPKESRSSASLDGGRYYTFARDGGGGEAGSLLLGTEDTLEEAVIAAADRSGERITTAESCTGGGLGSALTEVPGSSEIYLGGVVSYSYEMKERLLGVPRELLESRGAVSPECAEAMARGAEERLRGSVQIAITGIAGPGGGTPTKPVGLVYMARIHRGVSVLYEFRFSGKRREVRSRSVEAALLLLLDALEPPEELLLETIDGKRLTAG